MGIDTRDITKICPACFNDLDGNGTCPFCRKREEDLKNPPSALPVRTMLNGRYLVGTRLGMGGFGITYVGRDMGRSRKVVIKEFFPKDFAVRESGGTRVNVNAPEVVSSYNHWFNAFVAEAKILMQIKYLHGVVKLLDFFEANNSAYIITDYLEGQSLYAYLKERGYRISAESALNVLRPVFESLAILHEHGVIHKDISPENILIVQNKYVKLIDFGAASLYKMKTPEKPYSVLKAGYSPIEFYRSDKYKQGPYSDVYQIGATLYNCVTGYIPATAAEREKSDTLPAPSKLGFKVPHHVEKAIMRALALLPENRYHTIEQFMSALGI